MGEEKKGSAEPGVKVPGATVTTGPRSKKEIENERKRKEKEYLLLRKGTVKINGETKEAFVVVRKVKARNVKAVARMVRAGIIELERGEYYLTSRLTKLPALAFTEYKRERRK